MSKVPTRPYCSACKKRAHGAHCNKGNCGCKCRDMTPEQIKLLFTPKEEPSHTYSEESQTEFERIMDAYRASKDKPQPLPTKAFED